MSPTSTPAPANADTPAGLLNGPEVVDAEGGRRRRHAPGTRFATRGHFAAFTGTAPLQASSGDVERHRLSRRGNRQLNKVLHTAAKTQIRRGGPGRTYDDRKLAEGKSSSEALRALKRQLSDVVYRRLLADQQMRAARGGQVRTSPQAA